MNAVLWAIRRVDGKYYTHGYPGSWNLFPKLQLYQSKSAASRQLGVILGVIYHDVGCDQCKNVESTGGEG